MKRASGAIDRDNVRCQELVARDALSIARVSMYEIFSKSRKLLLVYICIFTNCSTAAAAAKLYPAWRTPRFVLY